MLQADFLVKVAVELFTCADGCPYGPDCICRMTFLPLIPVAVAVICTQLSPGEAGWAFRLNVSQHGRGRSS